MSGENVRIVGEVPLVLRGKVFGYLPLTSSAAKREAGVIGTLMLNPNDAVTTCSLLGCLYDACCPFPFRSLDDPFENSFPVDCTWVTADREQGCFSRDAFNVPFPCHCCGADCVCCPHSPRGGAWEAALASGFGPLLAEAGPLARSIKLSSPDVGAAYGGLAELVHARESLLNTHWVPRANAVLLAHGLRVAAFSYAYKKPNDKGWGGWSSRCVLQFYDNATYTAAQRRGTADTTGAAKT